MTTQREKAERLRDLHRPGDPVILVNAWDAISARIIESLGFPAIATTSAGVANLEGFPDGERISRDRMLAGVERVVRAVDVPVTADMEAAYGQSVEDAMATARGAIDAGAVGVNFEDAYPDGSKLLDIEAQAERVAAMREVGEQRGVPLVINARTDTFFLPAAPSDQWRLEEAVRRGNRFLEAGASSIFVPGVADEETIRQLCANIRGPVNILAVASSPPVARLAELGVARISTGSGTMAYALARFRDAAREILDSGTFAFMGGRIPHAELNRLLE
jgi:2-methylisocitrate lyase-like PEP mutase family enzyme